MPAVRLKAALIVLTAVAGALVPTPSRGQTPAGPPQGSLDAISNTQVATSGGQVFVTYDLAALPQARSFSVSLLVSLDDGRTFDLTPTSVTGDIGRMVAPGIGKRIVWDAGKDIETLPQSGLRARVTAVAADATERRGLSDDDPSLAPAARQGRAQSKGKLGLMSSLVLIGVGAALGGAAEGPLKANDPFFNDCVNAYGSGNRACTGFQHTRTNKPLGYAGIAIGGTGVYFAIRRWMSSSSQIVVIPGRRGVTVYREVSF